MKILEKKGHFYRGLACVIGALLAFVLLGISCCVLFPGTDSQRQKVTYVEETEHTLTFLTAENKEKTYLLKGGTDGCGVERAIEPGEPIIIHYRGFTVFAITLQEDFWKADAISISGEVVSFSDTGIEIKTGDDTVKSFVYEADVFADYIFPPRAGDKIDVLCVDNTVIEAQLHRQ